MARQYGIEPQQLAGILQQNNQLPAVFADVRRGLTVAAVVEGRPSPIPRATSSTPRSSSARAKSEDAGDTAEAAEAIAEAPEKKADEAE